MKKSKVFKKIEYDTELKTHFYKKYIWDNKIADYVIINRTIDIKAKRKSKITFKSTTKYIIKKYKPFSSSAIRKGIHETVMFFITDRMHFIYKYGLHYHNHKFKITFTKSENSYNCTICNFKILEDELDLVYGMAGQDEILTAFDTMTCQEFQIKNLLE